MTVKVQTSAFLRMTSGLQYPLHITNSVPSILKCQKSYHSEFKYLFISWTSAEIFSICLQMRKMHHFVSKYLFISCILLHQCNTKPLPHKKQHYCTQILQIHCYSPTMTKTCSTLGEGNSIQCSKRQYFEQHHCRTAVNFWQHSRICVQRRWIKGWQQNIIFLAAEYNVCRGG